MSTNLSSVPKLQFFDANGNPLVGGKLFTYAAGTTTPLATYTDSTGLTPNTNPIILDSRGEANVWLDATQYKFELKTSADALIWTVDNISNALNLSQLLASSGSAASPPYTFAADTTTGMYLAAAGQIGLSANGTPVFRSTDTQAVLDVNLQVSGTARRITGDFSNATLASRVLIQTTTSNDGTSVGAIPNGTSTNQTNFAVFNTNNPANASVGIFGVNPTLVAIGSDKLGTGSYLPMTFSTGGSERVRIDTSGNIDITNSSDPSQSFYRTTNSPGAGVGRITWDGQNASNARASYARIQGEITANTAGAHTGTLNFYTATAGALTEKMRIAATGDVGIGTSSPSIRMHIQNTTATTNAVTQILRIDSQSSGTPANGIGVGMEFATETAAGNTEIGATIEAIATDVTSTSEDFDLSFKTMTAGAAASEKARLTSTGLFQFNSGYGSVATVYGCRAWINFDGTSGSIGAGRASGNVSSVTDNGTGDYTINFTNAMPDSNYAPVFGYGQSESAAAYKFAVRLTTSETGAPTTMSTTALRVISGGTTNLDFANLYVAIFR
jgi:hypothetical protein